MLSDDATSTHQATQALRAQKFKRHQWLARRRSRRSRALRRQEPWGGTCFLSWECVGRCPPIRERERSCRSPMPAAALLLVPGNDDVNEGGDWEWKFFVGGEACVMMSGVIYFILERT